MPRKLIKFLSLILCFCFLFQQTGLAQVLPSLSQPQSQPLLRYLSVNSANPNNYFNFLMDKGNMVSQLAGEPVSRLTGTPANRLTGKLNSEAKKLINYFFLGITLPSDAFWVNLQPAQSDRITSEQLAKTDLGRTLLEQDLLLKKDMAKLLHPKNPVGKLYWEKLYSAIGKEKTKKTKITISNRVWITPDQAVVLETEDGALVSKASLKVMLELEYFVVRDSLNIKRDSRHSGESRNPVVLDPGFRRGDTSQDTLHASRNTLHASQDTLHKIRDTRYEIRDTRYEIRDTNNEIRTTRYKTSPNN